MANSRRTSESDRAPVRAAAQLQAIGAAILFSTGGAAIKVQAFSGMQVSSLRAGIAALALLLWWRGRVRGSWAAVAVGCAYAATLTLFTNATKLTTAAHAIFLQDTAPLYIIVFGPLLIRERVRLRDLVYLAAVGTGLIFCFIGRPAAATATAPDPTTGNVLGVLSSVTWALTLVGLRWAQRRDERGAEPIGTSAVLIGNVIAFAIGLPFIFPLPSASPVEWATVAYLGVVQIGVAYVLLTNAMSHLPALEVSLLLLLEPVLNPIWAWLVRGENPGAWVWAGGVIIIAATALKTAYDARTDNAAARSA
jgi:drug/metabolite transporter (DMT)-like permease